MIRLTNTKPNKFSAVQPGKRLHSSEAGYTILESIVAMVVVAVLMTAVAPVIVFAGATRLQARRVELATQAARTYMDGVKSGAILVRDPTTNTDLIPTVELTSTQYQSDRSTFQAVPAPQGTLTCSTTGSGYCTSPAAGNQLYCVDFDGTGCSGTSLRNMVVQAYRGIAPPKTGTTTGDPSQGYLLGVRVYRANSFQPGITLDTKLPSTTVTNALGARGLPLVTMTTEISPSDPKQGFTNYCRRLNDNCQL